MWDYSKVPPELTVLDQWVCWGKKGYKTQKERKKPSNPNTGYGANSTDPTDLVSFKTAVAAVESGEYEGIGFATVAGDGYIMVDLDTIRDADTGWMAPDAKDIVSGLRSYTEISMSGTGVHIICKGEENVELLWKKVPLAPNRIERYDEDGRKKEPEAEMYSQGRYFAFTGRGYGPRDIPDCSIPLNLIQTQLAQEKPGYEKADIKIGDQFAGSRVMNGKDYLEHGLKHDPALIKRWEGQRPLQNESRDDAGLMTKLAYWTNWDEEAMVEAFMASPHVEQKDPAHREKLDRDSYLIPTIQKAIQLCSSTAAYTDYLRQQDSIERASIALALMDTDGALALQEFHPEDNPRYAWNDLGNGNLFADAYKSIARYVPERKKWYVFNGKVWWPDTGGMAVAELCKRLALGLIKHAAEIKDDTLRARYLEFTQKWQQRRQREIILKDAASVYPVAFSEFDADPMVFNCKNGTLRLDSFEFHKHCPEDFLTKMSGAEYDPDAPCERWERFMLEVQEGNKDVIEYVQKAFGYNLTGDVSEECFFLLYGPKTRNGKGTTMETIRAMMGDYGRVAAPATLARKNNHNGSAPSEDLARLAGARFVNISEPEKGMSLDSAMVKTLTGSDTVSARFLNEGTIEFKPQFKIFINTNHLPSITDMTVFTSDRVRVIPFNRKFEPNEQDGGLKAFFARPESLSGILNWCVMGLKMKQLWGFTPPDDVRVASEEYHQDSDKIGRFIAQALIEDPNADARCSDVYDHYKRWCSGNGFKYENSPNFIRALGKMVTIVKNRRPRSGGNPTNLVDGYTLNTNFDEIFGAREPLKLA